MAGERLVIDARSEDAANAPLDLGGDGLYLMEHAYPPPPSEVQYAGTADSEGDVVGGQRYRNREIGCKLRVREPPGVTAATNLITNPSFEVDTTGWLSTDAVFLDAGATLTRTTVAGRQYVGEAGLQVETNGAVSSRGAAFAFTGTFTSGVTYRTDVYLKGNVGGEALRVFFGSRTASDWEDDLPTLTEGWARYSLSWTPVADRTDVVFAARSNVASGMTFQVDAVLTVQGSTEQDYFDGDYPGCAWTGTAHASTSTRPPSNGDRATAIIGDIQRKLAKVNREGGTLRRTLPNGNTIAFDLLEASGDAAFGNAFVHSNRSEMELKLTAKPFGRGSPTTLTDHAETTLPHLTFTETGIDGDVPALGKLVIDNDSATDQWFVDWGQQSENYSSSANAALHYEAEGRTAKSGSASAARSGASGGNVMRNTSLLTQYQPILSTQATGGGAHLSHVGTYRVWARVFDSNAAQGQVTLRLEWGEGDLSSFVTNDEVSPPVIGDFSLVNLGLVTLRAVAQGTQRWEGRITAKSSVLGDDIDVDCLFIVPVAEGYGEARGIAQTGAEGPVAHDEFDQSAGVLVGKVAPVGGTWAGAGDSDDFSVVAGSSHYIQRTAVSDTAVTGHYAVLGSTNYAACTVEGQMTSGSIKALTINAVLKQGIFARYVDTSNFLMAYNQWIVSAASQYVVVVKRVAGTFTILAAVPTTYNQETLNWKLRLTVDAAGRWALYRFLAGATPPAAIASGQDTVLATSGALDDGKPGLYDEWQGADALTRTMDNFLVTTPSTVSQAAIPGSQSLELRHDRVIREDSGGTVWQGVPKYEGDYLLIPPAGREGRSVRFFVKTSRNDPNTGADSAIDDLSARLTITPRYLQVPY